MNIRRKNRLWIACAVLAGLALTIGLVLYALRSNIDLFYTPGEILYGKRETQQMPEVGIVTLKSAPLQITTELT